MLQVDLERSHFVETELILAGWNLNLKIFVSVHLSVSGLVTGVDHPCGQTFLFLFYF